MAHLLGEEELAGLRSIWDQLDSKNQGYISAAVFVTVLHSLGVRKSEWEVKDLIADIDVGYGEKTLNFDNFVVLMTRSYDATKTKEETDEAFKELDADQDGRVEAGDLGRVFSKLGYSFTKEQLKEIVFEVSSSSSKGFSKEDFEMSLS